MVGAGAPTARTHEPVTGLGDLTSPPHLFAAGAPPHGGGGATGRVPAQPRSAFALRRDLLGNVDTGTISTFTVADPKPRVISAAPFLTASCTTLSRVCSAALRAPLIRDSYACRTGYGTHRASTVPAPPAVVPTY
jgi:hypothetical protein